jgi:hypothetical protein
LRFKKEQGRFYFPDINMPRLSGMELAVLLPKETKLYLPQKLWARGRKLYVQTIDYIKAYHAEPFPVIYTKDRGPFNNRQTADIPLPHRKRVVFCEVRKDFGQNTNGRHSIF